MRSLHLDATRQISLPRALGTALVGAAALVITMVMPALAEGSAQAAAGTQGGAPVTTVYTFGDLDPQLQRTVQVSSGVSADKGPLSLEICSGMLIKGGYVLTARHCLNNPQGQHWGFVRITLGAYADADGGLHAGAKCMTGPSQWRSIKSTAPGEDFGIIATAGCKGKEWRAASGTALSSELDLSVGAPTLTLGHPGDKETSEPLIRQLWRLDRPISESGSFVPAPGDYVETAGAVAAGISGAPLLAQDSSGFWQVGGILVSNNQRVATDWQGKSQVVGASARYIRVTPAVQAQIAAWELDLASR